jgi:cytochrome c553
MKKIAIGLLFASSTLLMADGAALFKKCAGCHGANGEKKALGKSAVIKGLDAAAVAKDLEGYKAGTTNKNGMGGVMKGQVATYTPEQIKEVSEYIAGLK